MRSPVSRNPEVVRARILDAAQAEFMAEGFAAASTNRILERFGGSKPTMFRHFPTKEALWTAVMEWVAERLMQRIERAVADAPGPLAALRSVFLAHAGFVVEHPGVPRMMFGELQRAEASAPKRMAQTLIRRYGERVRALLEAGQAAGEVAADIDLNAQVGGWRRGRSLLGQHRGRQQQSAKQREDAASLGHGDHLAGSAGGRSQLHNQTMAVTVLSEG